MPGTEFSVPGTYYFITFSTKEIKVDGDVIIVRIDRKTSGVSIPFDKLYFFKREHEDKIGKIFKFALVLPSTTEFVDIVKKLNPASLNHIKPLRDDTVKNVPLDINSKELSKWWKDNVTDKYDLNDRLVVIPVLTSQLRAKIKPLYLGNKGWFDYRSIKKELMKKVSARSRKNVTNKAVQDEMNDRQTIDDDAYLLTPYEAPYTKIKPVCHICPKLPNRVQGECSPGQPICYESLNFDFEKIKEKPIDNGSIQSD